MSVPTTPADLLDLKLMPAWVNEPVRTDDYANYQGEDERPFDRSGGGPQREKGSRPRLPKSREQRERGKRPEQRRPERTERAAERPRPSQPPTPLPPVAIRFIPRPAALESVIAQIKSGTVTYSVFALARMFLEKPERYDVNLTAPAEGQLFQLGENGAAAVDRRILEESAFAHARDDFYTVEVTQSEPVKGNFSNVARDRASGTLLGPTNHHSYQPQLRNLYEQRYSRRMSFSDYQRQIEIVSNPAAVEAWKEQARSVTTYTTRNAEAPVTFASLAEAERHFRQTHLPALLRTAQDFVISGVVSRRLPDRRLGRVIEDAWSAEVRSPSKMMQELAGGFRAAGLNIFRHRKGMLFVSPIRVRSFSHESAGVSASINSILSAFAEAPGTTRKQLAEKLTSGLGDPAESDKVKLSLASDLRWLITEGYVIEFNDGSLDVPRAKPVPQPRAKVKLPGTSTSEPGQGDSASDAPVAETAFSLAPEEQPQLDQATHRSAESLPDRVDAGGISVDQSVEPIESALSEIGEEASPAPREGERVIPAKALEP